MKIVPTFISKYSDKALEGVGKVVPDAVKNWVSNPKTAEFVENTFFAVSVETGLKMVGRPTFIMADKQADSKEKKKFAATKEMLYQGLCLGLYLGAMKHVKKFIYGIVSKNLSKNPENKIKIDAYNKELESIESLEKLMKAKVKEKGIGFFNFKAKKAEKIPFKDQINKIHHAMTSNPDFKVPKGAKELSAIIGSILMLTVVAPQISHFVIHPLMKALGFDKKPEGGHAPEALKK